MLQTMNFNQANVCALHNKGVNTRAIALDSLTSQNEKKIANNLQLFSQLFFSPYSMIQIQKHNEQHLYYIRRCSLWLEYLMLESLSFFLLRLQK